MALFSFKVEHRRIKIEKYQANAIILMLQRATGIHRDCVQAWCSTSINFHFRYFVSLICVSDQHFVIGFSFTAVGIGE